MVFFDKGMELLEEVGLSGGKWGSDDGGWTWGLVEVGERRGCGERFDETGENRGKGRRLGFEEESHGWRWRGSEGAGCVFFFFFLEGFGTGPEVMDDDGWPD